MYCRWCLACASAYPITCKLPMTYPITCKLPMTSLITCKLPMTSLITCKLPITYPITCKLPMTYIWLQSAYAVQSHPSLDDTLSFLTCLLPLSVTHSDHLSIIIYNFIDSPVLKLWHAVHHCQTICLVLLIIDWPTSLLVCLATQPCSRNHCYFVFLV